MCRHYNRSVELDASVGAVYANRALAHLKLKNFKETENDCDIALARGGDPVKVHFRRGLSRKEQSNWAGAHDDFEKVLLLDPEQKDAAKERDAMKKKLGLNHLCVDVNGACKFSILTDYFFLVHFPRTSQSDRHQFDKLSLAAWQ